MKKRETDEKNNSQVNLAEYKPKKALWDGGEAPDFNEFMKEIIDGDRKEPRVPELNHYCKQHQLVVKVSQKNHKNEMASTTVPKNEKMLRLRILYDEQDIQTSIQNHPECS